MKQIIKAYDEAVQTAKSEILEWVLAKAKEALPDGSQLVWRQYDSGWNDGDSTYLVVTDPSMQFIDEDDYLCPEDEEWAPGIESLQDSESVIANPSAYPEYRVTLAKQNIKLLSYLTDKQVDQVIDLIQDIMSIPEQLKKEIWGESQVVTLTNTSIDTDYYYHYD